MTKTFGEGGSCRLVFSSSFRPFRLHPFQNDS